MLTSASSINIDSLVGPLLILGACFSWGLDNNFTGQISSRDPVQIVLVKSLVAGAINICLAKMNGAGTPDLSMLAQVSSLGFISYGLSLILFVFALRCLGAARTGAYFATAPFFGAAVSIFVLHEPVRLPFVVGGLLMATGVLIHLNGLHRARSPSA